MNIVFGLLLLPKVLYHADSFYRSVEGVPSLTQNHPALLVSFVRAIKTKCAAQNHCQNTIKLAPLH